MGRVRGHRTGVSRVRAGLSPSLAGARDRGTTPGGEAGRGRSHLRTHFRPRGIREILGLGAIDPTGVGCFFVAPQATTSRPRSHAQRRWSRVSVHLRAGLRLRATVHGEAREGDRVEPPEAILESDGRIADARGAARPREAQEALRFAARSIDRARRRLRPSEEDQDEALELWQGLISGRWSLVDHHDSDGRRYFVARRNDPGLRDPRGLTLRERQVLTYVAMGHSLKLIAYELGLSYATAAQHRASAMRKLGFTSVVDVVRVFASSVPQVR